MSSVLARPGAPTIRLLPPTNSVMSTCEMTSSCPTMIFFSSVTISLRPAFMRSASAMSSGDARSTCGVTSVAILIRSPFVQFPTPKTQLPTTPKFPTSNSPNSQLGIGSWEWLGVGRWALGISFAFSRTNFSRLQRNRGDELLELRRVLRLVHALLEQPQRFDPPLEIAPLHVQRAQLRIGGQPVVSGDSQREHGGYLAVLVLRIGPRVRRIGAAFLVAVIVEQRVLGGEQTLALVGARDFHLGEPEGLEHADPLVLVRIRGF